MSRPSVNAPRTVHLARTVSRKPTPPSVHRSLSQRTPPIATPTPGRRQRHGYPNGESSAIGRAPHLANLERAARIASALVEHLECS